MEIGQLIQAVERARAPLPALTILPGLAHCLLAWGAPARPRQNTWLPCALVAARRPIGVIADRRR